MEQVRNDIKKAKGGRPIAAVKRQAGTGVRFTPSEYSIVQQKAAEAGLRTTPYIRDMALNGQVLARLTDEQKHAVRQLIGMANNINQMAKMAHKEGMFELELSFNETKTQLDQILSLFYL